MKEGLSLQRKRMFTLKILYLKTPSSTTSSSYRGGAILTDESEIELHSNIFSMNRKGTGSALQYEEFVDLYNNSFIQHTITSRGVVMILRGPSHSVKNNIFTDNNSDYGAPFILKEKISTTTHHK